MRSWSIIRPANRPGPHRLSCSLHRSDARGGCTRRPGSPVTPLGFSRQFRVGCRLRDPVRACLCRLRHATADSEGLGALVCRLDPGESLPARTVTNWLLADVGGTWARFAVLSESKLGPIHTLGVGAYASAADAIRHFTHCEANVASVARAVIAAAGPVAGGRCALTNSPWVLEAEELKRIFGLFTVNIVNDLEALACA